MLSVYVVLNAHRFNALRAQFPPNLPLLNFKPNQLRYFLRRTFCALHMHGEFNAVILLVYRSIIWTVTVANVLLIFASNSQVLLSNGNQSGAGFLNLLGKPYRTAFSGLEQKFHATSGFRCLTRYFQQGCYKALQRVQL